MPVGPGSRLDAFEIVAPLGSGGMGHVFVVELNDEGFAGIGQMGALIRSHIPDAKIRGITKTDGLTWKVKEILEAVKAKVAKK